MPDQKDIKTNFSALENRVLKLIHLHEQVQSVNQDLLAENRRLSIELEEEKGKTKRMEEGYQNLKEVEKAGTRQRISQIKKRIDDMIGELDKNMTLIEGNNK